MKKLLIYSFLIGNLLLLFSTANSQNYALVQVCSNMKVGVAIPSEFGRDTNQILVCVLIKGLNKGSFNRNLIRQVENNYHGKYIFIKGEEYPDLLNYSDTAIYRYVFYHDNHVSSNLPAHINYPHNTHNNTSSFSNSPIYSSSFGIWDRHDNSKYTPGHITSNYGMYVKGYMMNLENLRVIHTN